MIKYLTYTIKKVTHSETMKNYYELSHWYVSSDLPDIAGKKIQGYYESCEEAENQHVKIMVHEKFDKEKKE
jgi:hypothetical protein